MSSRLYIYMYFFLSINIMRSIEYYLNYMYIFDVVNTIVNKM